MAIGQTWLTHMATLWNPLVDLVPMALANTAPAKEPADALLSRMAMALHCAPTSLPPGALKRFFSGEGLDFLHIREYQPGDDLRQLDWTVFARTGEPHVREYQEEHHLNVWFLLDLTAPMAFGQSLPKWAFARQLAASLGVLATQAGHRCGFVLWNGDDTPQVVAPSKDPAHIGHALHQILLNAKRTQTPTTLPNIQALSAGRSVWFLLSDFAFLETLSHSEAWLFDISARHTVLPIMIVDPVESNLPKGHGAFLLQETSEARPVSVNLAHLPSRRRYQRQFAHQQKLRLQMLNRLGRPTVANTQTPLLEVLGHIVSGPREGRRP